MSDERGGSRGRGGKKRRQGQGRSTPAGRLLPPASRLQVLRGQDRLHQLQGRPAADAVHPGARQDSAAPDLRNVRVAPAQAADRDRPRASAGVDSVRDGLAVTAEASLTPRSPRPLRTLRKLCGLGELSGLGARCRQPVQGINCHGSHSERTRRQSRPPWGCREGRRRATRAIFCCRGSWRWRSPTTTSGRSSARRRSRKSRTPKRRHRPKPSRSGSAQLDIEIARRVGENQTLYGSVTSADIAHALQAKGFEIDKRKIQLHDPLKALGETHGAGEDSSRRHRAGQGQGRCGERVAIRDLVIAGLAIWSIQSPDFCNPPNHQIL